MFDPRQTKEPISASPGVRNGWRIVLFGILGAVIPIVVVGAWYVKRLADSGFPSPDVAQDLATFPGQVLVPSVVSAMVFALAAALSWGSEQHRDVMRNLIVIAGTTALIAWLLGLTPQSKGDNEGRWRWLLVFTGPVLGYFLARRFVGRTKYKANAASTSAAQPQRERKSASRPDSSEEVD